MFDCTYDDDEACPSITARAHSTAYPLVTACLDMTACSDMTTRPHITACSHMTSCPRSYDSMS